MNVTLPSSVDYDQLIGDVESAQDELVCNKDYSFNKTQWFNGLGNLNEALDIAFNDDKSLNAKNTPVLFKRKNQIAKLSANQLTKHDIKKWYKTLTNICDWLFSRYFYCY